MQTHPHLRSWFSLVILFTLLSCVFPAAPVFAETERSSAPVETGASWLDAQESAGIVYLLYASPNIIKRYRISTETWLSDIVLTSTPTAFRVTSGALYIAFGRRASKFSLNGTGEAHLLNTNTDIISLHVVNQLLLVNCSYDLYGSYISVNLTSGAIVDNQSYYIYSFFGDSVAPTVGKLFGRTRSISPSDIVQVSFSPDGMLGQAADSPYHGDYPDASKTWVSLNEKIVIDSAGIVYNTADLTYRNSLAGQVDDLAFYGDLPIVLRDGTLIAFSNIYMETGRITPANLPERIFVSGESLYLFSRNTQGPQVEKIAISSLNPADPGKPVDPNGLAYVPDKVVLGKDETVYLLSKKYQSIFRWNVSQRRYLSTIPLLDIPYTIAYAANENRLYVAYPNGSIFQIRLGESLIETAFTNLPGAPCGLAIAGSFVFTCSAWAHSVFAPTGETLSTKDGYYSEEYIWNAARKKMYFLRDDTSPNDLLWEDIDANGVIGALQDSPYHGSEGIQHPIRVKADGSVVLLGSGWIYDALSLAQVNTLANTITDASWKGSTLVTLRSNNNGSELQKWIPVTYGISQTRAVPGSPLNLFSIKEGWLVITTEAGKTLISIWSESLTQISGGLWADFSTSITRGAAPLLVKFTNQSIGQYNSALWDFGDGEKSTEKGPVHIYKNPGSYSVSLKVDGPYGSSTIVKTKLILAIYQTRFYLPYIMKAPFVPFIEPGKYVFNNLCQQYPLNINETYVGQMKECVPSVEVKADGEMIFNFTWTANKSPYVTECLIKYSDDGNKDMYIKDSDGLRYDHTEVGGAAGYISCMESGVAYPGWFKFPAATTPNTVFTFYDDDAWMKITPIILRAAP